MVAAAVAAADTATAAGTVTAGAARQGRQRQRQQRAGAATAAAAAAETAKATAAQTEAAATTTKSDFSRGNVTISQGCFRCSSAFYFTLVSSIRQSKTSQEARRASSVTEAATSLHTWTSEQHTFQSQPPAGRHLKISRIRDCAGSHRPAGFILICVSRAKTCASCDACKQ